MNKSSILIVEDEPLIAHDIARIVKAHGYTVAAIVDDAKSALEALNHEPDVALLDINIEGDVDGIDLAPSLKIPFIFLTSYYDEPTLERAKVVKPSGYIVKPFNERDLVANIEIASFRMNNKLVSRHDPVKLFVRKDQEILSINSSDIIYAKAFDNYTIVYTNQDKYIISHTLKSIEDKLLPLGFIRIHRSYLINFQEIDSISEGMVFLKGHQVLIGKSYRKDFFDRLSML
ncbi:MULTISPECIES: LytTR family transcriptional regulator DNA-binding domain-containing protein [unclassified Ekhidna]|jgi:DNA-binding LytR/AlgR family response regulator|uniref:LytR/AlgR family response regulator transcription factor n=1 Tax=unclassified Ekhidna TaxID=2632188 RepID=UPI0032DFF71C